MRASICCIAALMGAMGIATDVAAAGENDAGLAGKRGLSPIISFIASGQSVLDQIKADLNLTQGEVTMLIPDLPNMPPQDVPVMIAQANQAQQGATVTERKIGLCAPIANMPDVAPNLTNVLDPKILAQIYFDSYEPQSVDGPVTVTVLQNPKHGVLRLVTEADHLGSGVFDPADPGYVYLPEQGYLGNDSVTMLVDIGGKTVKEVIYFKVVDHPVNNDGDLEICKKGPFWKISSNLIKGARLELDLAKE